MNATLPTLLTPVEVGIWLSWPTARVVRAARRGEIPHILLPNGDVMFEKTDLSRWAATLRRALTASPAEDARA
jgi:hypothetical protein